MVSVVRIQPSVFQLRAIDTRDYFIMYKRSKDRWQSTFTFGDPIASVISETKDELGWSEGKVIRRFIIYGSKESVIDAPQHSQNIAKTEAEKHKSKWARDKARFKDKFLEWLHNHWEGNVTSHPDDVREAAGGYLAEAEAYGYDDWVEDRLLEYETYYEDHAGTETFKPDSVTNREGSATVGAFELYDKAVHRDGWDKQDAYDHVEKHFPGNADRIQSIWEDVMERAADSKGKDTILHDFEE